MVCGGGSYVERTEKGKCARQKSQETAEGAAARPQRSVAEKKQKIQSADEPTVMQNRISARLGPSRLKGQGSA